MAIQIRGRRKKPVKQAEEDILSSTQQLEAGHGKQQSHGKRRDREFEISYRRILEAADQGKKWAIVELGAYAEYQRDYRRAIEQYEKLAVQGDIYYMRRIAVIYEQSLESLDSAIDWYTEAGHYGDEYSMIRAGNLLEVHFEDYEEALAWYRKAAQAGSLAAIYQLCRIYQYNLRNFDMAIEWYRRAVQMGDLRSAVSLGQLYENDLKNFPKAVEWYSLAAGQKNLYAINLLCQLYETKLRDYPRAIEWYKKAIALYDEQNGAEQMSAADTQGQKSLNTARAHGSDQVATPPLKNGSSPYAESINSAINPVADPEMANLQVASTEHGKYKGDFDDGLLPHPDDLTPAEIASASLPSEAEVEFLG